MLNENVDVCVIGSGAGGSLMAFEAARRGLSTLVLERGPEVSAAEMNADEQRMIPTLYKDGGLQTTASHDLFILQGSCVGGSTVLSNMVLLRTPPAVLERWQREGLSVSAEQMRASSEAVEQELGGARVKPANVSRSAERLYAGAAGLALRAEWMTKALGSCPGCGLCNVGCLFGTKRDARETYLRWARENGARVLANTEVTRLVRRGGIVRDLEARRGRAKDQLRVRAKLYVLSGGAIASSALLLQSGIRKNVGTRLSFNAGAMVTAEFPDPLDAFDGDQMSVFVTKGDITIECTHNPLMSASLTTPGWFGDHGSLMARTRYLAYAGGLVGTEATGRVALSRLYGHEEVHFKLSESDMRQMRLAIKTIAELFFAAGARRVALPTHRYYELRSPSELSSIERVVRSQKDVSAGSAHPQGGNPLGTDPQRAAVDGQLFVHGVENLAVCDASVFPSTVQVNPIETILALGKCLAPRIMARA